MIKSVKHLSEFSDFLLLEVLAIYLITARNASVCENINKHHKIQCNSMQQPIFIMFSKIPDYSCIYRMPFLSGKMIRIMLSLIKKSSSEWSKVQKGNAGGVHLNYEFG